MNNDSNDHEADTILTEQVATRPATAYGSGQEPQQQAPSREVASGQPEPRAEPAEPETVEDIDELPRKATRKRPKPGERRLQILQTLAEMLEQPKGERITTAALAAKLQVSEAALYRHFASKAQMFEGLIEFIESTLFGLINQITTHEEDGFKQLRQILTMLLSFAERNPGMTRVIIGDALVTEDDRLQVRINQLVDRLELSIKQSFRTAVAQGRLPQETDPSARANLLLSYVQGRWLRFAKSGFKRSPMEGLDAQVLLLIM
jgi:TetR/AcrR family transcriptional regulator